MKLTPKSKMYKRIQSLKSIDAHKSNPLPYMIQIISDYETKVDGYINNFPAKERHACCLRLRTASSDMRKYTITAIKSEKKMSHLYKLDIECEFIRSEWRYAFGMKYINIRQYIIITSYLKEIGAQIGAWINGSKIDKTIK